MKYLAVLCIGLGATIGCGDSGTTSLSASGTDGPPVTVSTGDPPTTGTAPTGTASETDDTGTASASEGTTGPGPTTSPTTGTDPTGVDMTCVDTPPPGYDGPSDPACAAEPQVGVFEPIVEWSRDAWAVEPTSAQILMTPIVVPLDGDEVPDLVFVTYVQGNHYGPGVLRAMKGDGSAEIFNVAGAGVCGHSGLAAGDIDGDGAVEIVAVTTDPAIAAFEADGTLKWKSPTYDPGILHCGSYPAIADLDADGTPEIVVNAIILDADGSERGVGEHGNSGFASLPADIDEDGVQEVLVGDAAYDDQGATLWFNGAGDGLPGVADFDGDGLPEIVVSGAGKVRLQDNLGAVIWSSDVPDGPAGAPTIADYDGDGAPEIGVAGSVSYVVFDGDGAVLWQKPISETASATGSIVYDFEGDGVADVIHADENRVWVFSGIDGAVKLEFSPHGSGTQFESPAVVDADGDGQVEIVFGNNQFYGPEFPTGITVIGDAAKSWRPGRKIWNQYAYNITNVEDDGSIPAVPQRNWELYNNYRSGDISPADGTAAPDVRLAASVCQYQCMEQSLQLWVNVGNEGASPLTAGVTVEVYGVTGGVETLITSQPFLDVLDPGKYADALGFVIDGQDYESLLVRAVAGEAQCKDDNDEVALAPPFCTPPG